jgi:hypothetical protein
VASGRRAGDILTSPSLPGFALALDTFFVREDH